MELLAVPGPGPVQGPPDRGPQAEPGRGAGQLRGRAHQQVREGEVLVQVRVPDPGPALGRGPAAHDRAHPGGRGVLPAAVRLPGPGAHPTPLHSEQSGRAQARDVNKIYVNTKFVFCHQVILLFVLFAVPVFNSIVTSMLQYE